MYSNIDFCQKYALKVVNALFTKEELVRTVIINPGNNTTSLRTRCDEEVLKITQSKFIFIFFT